MGQRSQPSNLLAVFTTDPRSGHLPNLKRVYRDTRLASSVSASYFAASSFGRGSKGALEAPPELDLDGYKEGLLLPTGHSHSTISSLALNRILLRLPAEDHPPDFSTAYQPQPTAGLVRPNPDVSAPAEHP